MGVATLEMGSAQLSMDLSMEEQNTLHRCEAVIERNRQAFIETGNALLTIRDGKLYRAAHETFEEYLRGRWDFGKSHGYRMMEAAEVVRDLSPIGEVLPVNEAQARPLTPLETPEERQEVWKEAVETAPEGKVTAAHVQAVTDKHLGKPEPEKPAERPTTLGLLKKVSPEPEESEELLSEAEETQADKDARIRETVAEKAEAAGLPIVDNRTSTKAPETAAPAKPEAPSPASGNFVQHFIPRDEDDWLWENDLTAATAIAELREIRPQLYNANLSLRRPQLTPKAERALTALLERRSQSSDSVPTTAAVLLETILVVRCKEAGITLDESEESDDE